MSTYVSVCAALADPTRRTVFELLATEPRSVGALARELPVSRPAVSQHLRVLREAHLVTSTQDGTRRVYAADPTGLRALRDYLDRLWPLALATFKALAETPEEEHSR